MRQLLAPVALVAALLSPRSLPHHAVAAIPAADSLGRQAIEIFHLSLRGAAESTIPQSVELILSSDANGYRGYVLSGAHSTLLEAVAIQGDTLRAGLSSAGQAKLLLDLATDVLGGTLTVEGRVLKISGERIF
jgi:hypothetical protein